MRILLQCRTYNIHLADSGQRLALAPLETMHHERRFQAVGDFEPPAAPDELRRHVHELARGMAAHAHNVAAPALESMRLSAMANQLEQTIGSPEPPEP